MQDRQRRSRLKIAAELPRGVIAAAVLLVLVIGLSSCGGDQANVSWQVPGGNTSNGAQLIHYFGCGTCHSIPGVAGANGLVGPPLNNIGSREVIAGVLPNTPDNLIHWIRDPQSVVKGNDMPDMGISRSEARDIAAYLETLR